METFESFAKDSISNAAIETCENCWHHRHSHCSMFSSECATQVSRHVTHPHWWTSYEEGEANERLVLNSVKAIRDQKAYPETAWS